MMSDALPNTTAISAAMMMRASVFRVMVLLLMVVTLDQCCYRLNVNAGFPPAITHTAGVDAKLPLPRCFVSVPAVPS